MRDASNAALLGDIQARIAQLQGATARNSDNAELLRDIQGRIGVLQSEVEKNANAAALDDLRKRVINIENGLEKFQSRK